MFIKIIDLQLLAAKAEIPKRYVLLKLNFTTINQGMAVFMLDVIKSPRHL